jgi:general stress protein 26
MRGELAKLYEKIEKLETAMMTTRRPDGHLVSRAMATQKHAPGADLWFVTRTDSGKVPEIEHDPHVNLAYYKDATHEWISVSGLGRVSQDRATIRELYAPDWKLWFGEEGDPRHGTPDDPRIALVGIEVHSAVFLEADKPQPVVLFEIVKGWLTGEAPELGTLHTIQTRPGPSA